MDILCVCLPVLFAILPATVGLFDCTDYYVIMEETMLDTQYFLEPLAASRINWGSFSDVDEVANCLVELECTGMETTCEAPYDIKPKYGPDEKIGTNISWFPFGSWFPTAETPATTISSYINGELETAPDTLASVLLLDKDCIQDMAEFIFNNNCNKILNIVANYSYLYDCQTPQTKCEDVMTGSSSTTENSVWTMEPKCTNNYIIVEESVVNNNYLAPFKMNNIIDWRNLVNVSDTNCYLEVGCTEYQTPCYKAHNIKNLYDNSEIKEETKSQIPYNINPDNITTTPKYVVSLTTLPPHTTISETQTPSNVRTIKNADINNIDTSTEGSETTNEMDINNMNVSQNNTELDHGNKSDVINDVSLENTTVNVDNKIASQNSTYLNCKYIEENCTSEINKLTSAIETVHGIITNAENKTAVNYNNFTGSNNLTDAERKESHLQNKTNKQTSDETNGTSKPFTNTFNVPNKIIDVLNYTTTRPFSTTETNTDNFTTIKPKFETSSGSPKHGPTSFTPTERATRGYVINENNGETGAYRHRNDNDNTLKIFLTITSAVACGTILYLTAVKVNECIKSGQYRINEY